ncbi:unnamed protein product [Effrenium voratum]|nr:unnamed protein product [Effrenium voratum]
MPLLFGRRLGRLGGAVPAASERRETGHPADVAACVAGAAPRRHGAAPLQPQPADAVGPPLLHGGGECAQLIDLGFKTCKRHNSEAQQMQRPAVGTQEELRGVATASLEVEDLPPEHRRLMAEMQRRVAELTGVPVHQHEEINPFLKFDQPAGQDLQGDDLSIGLHMDVNGGFPFCVCSVIIYLNDVEQGGRTVFPCTDLRCRELGCQLARAGHTHTSHSSASGKAADLVRLAGEEGLRISPRAGAALWFFSLGDAGEVDGSSWHGGAAVGGHLGKWTLQIFKEVPLPQRTDLGAFCAALRRRAAGLATADLTSLD